MLLKMLSYYFVVNKILVCLTGEHITDTYITETDTAELENLTHTLS